MSLKLTTPPAEEAISLQDAKDFLRVDGLEDDDLITSLIVTARQRAETITRRALITSTWRYKRDFFPSLGLSYLLDGGVVFRAAGGRCGAQRIANDYAIVLPVPPVQSVTSVQYLDPSGALQTFSSSNYTLDTDSEPARIMLTPSAVWPLTQPVPGAVRVTFVAGYGLAAAVPEGIKTYLKMRVSQLYDNRGSEKDESLDLLLDPYCWGSYA